MAILEKKHDLTVFDFDINDCNKIIEIYEEAINLEGMLKKIRSAYYLYMRRKFKRKTPEQLKKSHDRIRKRAEKLLHGLQNETDTHFLNSLVSAMAGTKSPTNIDDETYKLLMKDAFDNLRALETPFTFTKTEFEYLHTNTDSKGRAFAENDFVRDLSFILTKYFEKHGGRIYDDYEEDHRGWKVLCIEYLLNRVEISWTRGQISGAIGTKKSQVK